jgi:hypothetical protein
MLFRLLRYFLWIGCFVHKIFFLAVADAAAGAKLGTGLNSREVSTATAHSIRTRGFVRVST